MKTDAPVLILFSRTSHLADIPLTHTMRIGRQTGTDDPDIAVASLALEKDQGVFQFGGGTAVYHDTAHTGNVLYNGTPPEEDVPLHDGDILTFTRGSVPMVSVICSTLPVTGIWESLPLPGRDEVHTIQDPDTVFRRESGYWAMTDSLGKSHILKRGQFFRTPASMYYYTGELLFCAGAPIMIADEDGDFRVNIIRQTAPSSKALLLKDIAFAVSDGSLVLILGGSGAGKTTLMHAVMGYEEAQGEILYHGTDLIADYDRFRSRIGYVPQNDLLRDHLTVRETLAASVQMKAPSVPAEARIRRLLELFGLENEEHKLVSLLSGGQRKRLGIAVEFAGDPALFFLDEPDTGLDAVMGTELMKQLRTIADLGRIVFVSTHSANRYAALFDRVIVVARSDADHAGHLAFAGTVPDALRFFSADSLEDIVRRITRKADGGDGLADRYIRIFAERRNT